MYNYGACMNCEWFWSTWSVHLICSAFWRNEMPESVHLKVIKWSKYLSNYCLWLIICLSFAHHFSCSHQTLNHKNLIFDFSGATRNCSGIWSVFIYGAFPQCRVPGGFHPGRSSDVTSRGFTWLFSAEKRFFGWEKDVLGWEEVFLQWEGSLVWKVSPLTH